VRPEDRVVRWTGDALIPLAGDRQPTGS